MNPESTVPTTPSAGQAMPAATPTPPSPPPAPSPAWQPPINQSAANPSSKKGLIVGIIVGVVVLILALLGILAYMFVFSPSAQAKNTSTLFMHYMTTGDVAKAAPYSTGTASDLSTIAPSVHGSYMLSQSTMQDGSAYYLYSLTNAKDSYARTTLKKTNGVWKVVSFVFSSEALKLVPSVLATAPTAPSSTTTTTTTSGTCLVSADYDGILKEINGTTTSNTYVYTADNEFNSNVHFNADTLNFVDPASSQEGIVTAFANFYKDNSAKQFTIHLKGSVATTAQSDLTFANQRSAKIQTMLEADGVPAAKIVVDTPQSVAALGSDQASNAAAQQTARSVVLSIAPPTTCDGKSSSGR